MRRYLRRLDVEDKLQSCVCDIKTVSKGRCRCKYKGNRTCSSDNKYSERMDSEDEFSSKQIRRKNELSRKLSRDKNINREKFKTQSKRSSSTTKTVFRKNFVVSDDSEVEEISEKTDEDDQAIRSSNFAINDDTIQNNTETQVIINEDTQRNVATKDTSQTLNLFGTSYHKECHKCTRCKQTFDDSFKLKRHMMVHMMKSDESERKSSHACYICRKRFSERSQLWTHMRSHSDTSRMYKCSRCNQTYKSSRNFHLHKLNCSDSTSNTITYQCPNCRKLFDNDHALDLHKSSCPVKTNIIAENNSSKIVELKYRCSICKKKFADVFQMRRHKEKHVTEESAVEEPTATPAPSSRTIMLLDNMPPAANSLTTRIDAVGSSKISSQSANTESNSVSKVKTMAIEKIRKSQANASTIKKNEQQISGDSTSLGLKPKFKCCQQVFSDRNELFTHMKQQAEYTGNVPKCNPMYVCSICYVNFSERFEWYKHCKNRHKKNFESAANKPFILRKPRYACGTCFRKFDDTVRLKQHKLNSCKPHSSLSINKLQSTSIKDTSHSGKEAEPELEPVEEVADENEENVCEQSVVVDILTESDGSELVDGIENQNDNDGITNTEMNIESNKPPVSSPDQDEYRCDICDDVFEDRATLLEHEAFHKEFEMCTEDSTSENRASTNMPDLSSHPIITEVRSLAKEVTSDNVEKDTSINHINISVNLPSAPKTTISSSTSQSSTLAAPAGSLPQQNLVTILIAPTASAIVPEFNLLAQPSDLCQFNPSLPNQTGLQVDANSGSKESIAPKTTGCDVNTKSANIPQAPRYFLVKKTPTVSSATNSQSTVLPISVQGEASDAGVGNPFLFGVPLQLVPQQSLNVVSEQPVPHSSKETSETQKITTAVKSVSKKMNEQAESFENMISNMNTANKKPPQRHGSYKCKNISLSDLPIGNLESASTTKKRSVVDFPNQPLLGDNCGSSAQTVTAVANQSQVTSNLSTSFPQLAAVLSGKEMATEQRNYTVGKKTKPKLRIVSQTSTIQNCLSDARKQYFKQTKTVARYLRTILPKGSKNEIIVLSDDSDDDISTSKSNDGNQTETDTNSIDKDPVDPLSVPQDSTDHLSVNNDSTDKPKKAVRSAPPSFADSFESFVSELVLNNKKKPGPTRTYRKKYTIVSDVSKQPALSTETKDISSQGASEVVNKRLNPQCPSDTISNNQLTEAGLVEEQPHCSSATLTNTELTESETEEGMLHIAEDLEEQVEIQTIPTIDTDSSVCETTAVGTKSIAEPSAMQSEVETLSNTANQPNEQSVINLEQPITAPLVFEENPSCSKSITHLNSTSTSDDLLVELEPKSVEETTSETQPVIPRIFVKNISELMDPKLVKKVKKKETQKQKKFPSKCEDCGIIFKKARAARKHQRIASFRNCCKFCNFHSCKFAKLKQHCKDEHQLGHLCFHCRAVFVTADDLRNHSEVHKCPKCNRPYKNSTSKCKHCDGDSNAELNEHTRNLSKCKEKRQIQEIHPEAPDACVENIIIEDETAPAVLLPDVTSLLEKDKTLISEIEVISEEPLT